MGALVLAALAGDCSIDQHTVIAFTGTTLGIELTQDRATQFPRIKAGYNRAELALVPSNRSAEKEPGSRLAATGRFNVQKRFRAHSWVALLHAV